MKLSTTSTLLTLLSLLIVIASQSANAQPASQKVPAEVQAIVGTFQGSWTSYTLNEKGEVVKQSAWTDTIRAEKPTATADRAFVETTDEMIFEGGRIPPQKVIGKEGYLIGKDGVLGDYFIEMFGQTIPMKKLAKDVVSYSAPAGAREFSLLGNKFISATHVLVKITTFDQGTEIHNITRISNAQWKDSEGKERTTQFVSLTGQHRKVKQ